MTAQKQFSYSHIISHSPVLSDEVKLVLLEQGMLMEEEDRAAILAALLLIENRILKVAQEVKAESLV